MKLSIVIPAYNEEEGIASIIERSLAARAGIARSSPVTDLEIIVVSDGSTDRTAEIARGYHDIRFIAFEKNRGYGAAIKRGFEESTGELVGFLDADGTCDPNFFATLCSAILEEDAEVAIGSRMGPQSRMPRIRRLGNRIYAFILSTLSNKLVTDTASGMRVIRRDALPQLYPLPDGLHFTPAMSARVLMDHRMSIVERPMSYEERIGESKLHVIRDGLRFFRTIFEMSLMWRPTRMFLGAAMLCIVTLLLLATGPLERWITQGILREDVIYRLLFCSFLGTCAASFVSAAVLCEQLQRHWDERARGWSFVSAGLDRLYTFGGLALVSIPCLPLLGWLVGPGIWTRITEGVVHQHWSRAVIAGLIAFTLTQMFVTVLLTNLVRFHSERKKQANSVRHVRTVSGRIPPTPAPRTAVLGSTGELSSADLDYQSLPCQ